MSRAGVTYEQISAVAAAMAKEGRPVTLRALREALGAGSPNTILRHLQKWREGQNASSTLTRELSPEFLASLGIEFARAEEAARQEFSDALEQAADEIDLLTKAGEESEREIVRLQDLVATLTSQRDTLAGRADQQALELEQLKHVQQARIDAEQHSAVLGAQLASMLDRAMLAEKRLETIEAASQAAHDDLAAARRANDSLIHDLKNVQEQLIVVTGLRDALAGRFDQVVSDFDAAKSLHQEQLRSVTASLARAEQSEAVLAARLADAQARIDAAESKALVAEEAANQARIDAAELRGRIAQQGAKK